MSAVGPALCGLSQPGKWMRRRKTGWGGLTLVGLVVASIASLQGALGDNALDAPPITFTIPSQRLRDPDGKMEFRMGFGSCSQKRDRQPAWQGLEKEKVHAFGWMGDAVYTDFSQLWVIGQKNVRKPAGRRKFFQEQLVHRDYFAFWRSSFSLGPEACGKLSNNDCGINSSEPVVTNPEAVFFSESPAVSKEARQLAFPILGTWDDHDYGQDNAYYNFKTKEESQTMYLDFLGVTKQSPRRKQLGVYSSYYFAERTASGKVGTFAKVIFLDARYFKKPRIVYRDEADMLGEYQWDWLETQLNETRGEPYVIIVSSIQFLTQMLNMESWVDDAPADRIKLLKMIHKSNKEHNRTTLFVSGDIHQSENVGMKCSDLDDAVFYELTTSGMTPGVGLSGFFEPLMTAPYAAPGTHDTKHINFGVIRLLFDKNAGPDNDYRGGEKRANLDIHLIDQNSGPEVFSTSTTMVKDGLVPSWVQSTECLALKPNAQQPPPAEEVAPDAPPATGRQRSSRTGWSKKDRTAATLAIVGVALLAIAALICIVQHKRHSRGGVSHAHTS